MTVKPNEKEEEYFARIEFGRRKEAEAALQASLAGRERERLRELHYMKCPKCGMNLLEVDYRGIKVDKCSACDGVWLDAGELDAVAELEKGALDKLFSVFRR